MANKTINILQIGEGNFLRGFAEDYIQDVGSEWAVAVCQPRVNTRAIDLLKHQNFCYDVIMRGAYKGEIVDRRRNISCIADCIDTVSEYAKIREIFSSPDLKIVISNTTEAGICFDESDSKPAEPNPTFPGKVTSLLYDRFNSCGEDVIFLPVELIENNGDELKRCVLAYAKLWQLGDAFEEYVNTKCHFCNTLVDRIVSGHNPEDEDPCSVSCEPYKSWIIQADEYAKNVIPFADVTFAEDLQPYRTRKVRILNGLHTSSVLAGYLYGYDIVRDVVNDEVFTKYISMALTEIKSTINLPTEELDEFANAVIERFNNPFIDHKLLDISLNSISKFKARCLCTILDYYKNEGKAPEIMTFGLAALLKFYNGEMTDSAFISQRGADEYMINDNAEVISFFSNAAKSENYVEQVLKNKNFWDIDLTELDGFYELVKSYYDDIQENGIRLAVKKVICDE